MAVYKDNATGTWRVVFRYTDFTGERKQTQKRGFQTKREAQAWESKSHMIEKKILPYSGKRKIADIEAKDVIAWQNELMKYRDEKGKPYSGDYLKTIHAQLTAIFNHAVNFYNLSYKLVYGDKDICDI